jgi:L-cysteine/cystine lyase
MGIEEGPDVAKLRQLRELLPATSAGIYLDTAARGPLPAETAAAMRDADDWELRVGRATEGRDEDLAQRVEEAKAVLAALIVGDPADVTLTAGVGHALSICAWAPDWRAGDRAIVVGHHHADALRGLAERFGLDLMIVEAKRIPDKMTPRTRLVMLPHVDPSTGALLPTQPIAQATSESGTWLVLDASLSAGAIALDVTALGVDFVALPGDRWLLGPEATGALWIGPRPRAAGFMGDWAKAELGRTAVLGLARSVGWLEMYVGLEWAYARGRQLTKRLHAALSVAPGVELLTDQDALATVACFRLPAWPVEEGLAELRRRVFAVVSPTQNRTAIRASVAWFNTEEEIDRFAEAVVEIARHTPETIPRRPPLVVR